MQSTPRVAYVDGKPLIFWMQDNRIMYQQGLDQQVPGIAVEGASASGSSDFNLAQSSQGSLALVWGAAVNGAQEIAASIYDRTFDRWSGVLPVTGSGGIKRSLSATLDDQGNLNAVYNRVKMIAQENSDFQPGGTDLDLAAYRIGHDLAIAPEEIIFSTENPVPGSRVTVTAGVANNGELAESDILVEFYDGNPASGGLEIGTATTGTIAARDSAAVSVTWNVPASFTSHKVYVIVDPGSTVADRDRNNNLAFATAVQPDLEITESERLMLSPDKYLVTVKVANKGYVTAPGVKVTLAAGSPEGTVLETREIGDLQPTGEWQATFARQFTGAEYTEGIASLYFTAGSNAPAESNTGNNVTRLLFRQPEQKAAIAVTGITLPKGSIKMALGETEYLVENITPVESANPKVNWSSDKESIAAVDSEGKVSALSYGSATIIATTEDGGFQAQATVAVLPPPVITINGPAAINMVAGQGFADPGATAVDSDGTTDISDRITVSGSNFNANLPGKYTITYYGSNSDGFMAEARTRTVVVAPRAPWVSGEVKRLNVYQVTPFASLKLFDNQSRLVASAVANGSSFEFTAVPVGSGYYVTQTVNGVEGAWSNQAMVLAQQPEPGPIDDGTGGDTGEIPSPPVITLNGPAEIKLVAGQGFTDPGATAVDGDGTTDISNRITVAGNNIDTSLPGRYTVTYNCSNTVGLIAEARTRTVVVAPPAPGASGGVKSLKVTQVTSSGLLKVFDNSNLLVASSVATGSDYEFQNVPAGSGYYVTQTVNGVESAQSVLVTVLEKQPEPGPVDNGDVNGDTGEGGGEVVSRPVITLNGPAVINLVAGQGFADPGATAVDSDGTTDISNRVIVSGSDIDTRLPGQYTITYFLGNAVGLMAEARTRTVVVAPPTPGASGGVKSLNGNQVTPFALLKLYDYQNGLVASAEANGTSYEFQDVPAGTGYYVTQIVNGVESSGSNPVTVLEKQPEPGPGDDGGGTGDSGQGGGQEPGDLPKEISQDNMSQTVSTGAGGETIVTYVLLEEATEIIHSLQEKGETRLDINLEDNTAASVVLTVPSMVMRDAGGLDVQINTGQAVLELPFVLVESLAETGQDLNISVERGTARQVTEDLLGVPGTRGARILGEPTEIQANIKGNTFITISLPDIPWPADIAARQKLLDNLAVLVLHSDGDKQVVKGTVAFDAQGQPTSIKVSVDKFSTFIVIEQNAVSLKDIDGHWAEGDILQLAALGATGGYPDGTFNPDKTITRAEFVKVLVMAFNLNKGSGITFKDTASHWAREYVDIAATNGLVAGYDQHQFKPNEPITREQMAVIIARALKLTGAPDEISFTDVGQVSPWARGEVAAMIKEKIIFGYSDGTLHPKTYATRAQAMAAILRALKAKAN